MADYMLYLGTSAGPQPDDAYRAALVFAAATAMVEYMKANNPPADVRVALLGDGVMLMDDSVAKHTIPPGRPGTLFQMIADAVNAGVKIHC